MSVLTLIVGAIFVGCCSLFVLFIVSSALVAFDGGTGEATDRGVVFALFVGFGLLFAAAAYWSGSWLFLQTKRLIAQDER